MKLSDRAKNNILLITAFFLLIPIYRLNKISRNIREQNKRLQNIINTSPHFKIEDYQNKYTIPIQNNSYINKEHYPYDIEDNRHNINSNDIESKLYDHNKP